MVSYPTLHEIKAAADEYWTAWQELLAARPELRQAVGQHSPTALGWKVEGEVSPLEVAERLYELGDHVYMGPVNGERAILTIQKPQAVALDTLQAIKVLQRRPSRPEDQLGPDSLDLHLPHGVPGLETVQKSLYGSGAKAEHEHNEFYRWLSVKYKKYEFKLQDHTLWEICAKEAARVLGADLTIA
ncbi:MAG TPA: hypothetical protein VGH44_00130 [Candidatus Saccharimonadia bacterium]|jgi:hypothetical protein